MLDELKQRSLTQDEFIEAIRIWREESTGKIEIYVDNDNIPKKIKSLLRKYRCAIMEKYSC